jgi:hypothetical protein
MEMGIEQEIVQLSQSKGSSSNFLKDFVEKVERRT